MKFALGTLKWTPDAFWNATISEVMAASEGHSAQFKTPSSNPMKPDELEEMMKQFPDE